MTLFDRLNKLKEQYQRARKWHKPRRDIEREMVHILLRQMKREIRQDKKTERQNAAVS